MSCLREEFLCFARKDGANVSELCRRYEISRTCGYKWLNRVSETEDRSRRPHHSPARCSAEVESRVIAARLGNKSCGGRKLYRILKDSGMQRPPSPSTITEILRRHGLLTLGSEGPRDWQRFEMSSSNELWQMDFKGHFAMLSSRCHPLTAIDDCTRFSPVLKACDNERSEVVRDGLTEAFQTYGLPLAILCDRGGPWGGPDEITQLAAWIMRHGIHLWHGKPKHPQTQGKVERFHGTMVRELLQGTSFANLTQCQEGFDEWRRYYNNRRPHFALDYDTPAKRYTPSPRPFPNTLPPIEYETCDSVRKVQQGGEISFKGKEVQLGKGLAGLPVGIRPTQTDGLYEVRFLTQVIKEINLRDN